MARTSFSLAALTALVLGASVAAAPAASQEEYVWTEDRPDGVPPAGMTAAQLVPAGVLQVTPRLSMYDMTGLRFGNRFISLPELFNLEFQLAPVRLATTTYAVDVYYGVSDDITLLARGGYVKKTREVFNQDFQFFELDSDDLADAEVHALWKVYDTGPYRAHLQGGVSLPIGSVDEEGGVPGLREQGPLPYDMQTGAGVFGVIPGATVQAMNEHGSVGLQVQGRVYYGENDRGYRPGDAVEGNAWAAYRINSWFSVSSGVRASTFGAIEGFDEELNEFRDPGELSLSFGGERVDIPLGLNVQLGGGPLADHRLGLEFLFNVHEELDGPLLAADDGWVLSWTARF